MLANLKIENVAVIEKAEVNFTHGFTVLTGETGAPAGLFGDGDLLPVAPDLSGKGVKEKYLTPG